MKTRLDKTRPNLAQRVRAKQARMADQGSHKVRHVCVGDEVLVKNFSAGATWLNGVVVGVITACMCEVKLYDGRIIRRHIDHVRALKKTMCNDDKAIVGFTEQGQNHEVRGAPEVNWNIQMRWISTIVLVVVIHKKVGKIK